MNSFSNTTFDSNSPFGKVATIVIVGNSNCNVASVYTREADFKLQGANMEFHIEFGKAPSNFLVVAWADGKKVFCLFTFERKANSIFLHTLQR